MAKRFDLSQAGSRSALDEFLARDRNRARAVDETVRKIIAEVRGRGLDAIILYTKQFDNFYINETNFAVTSAEVETAMAVCDPADLQALEFAAARIRAFHERQKPEDLQYEDCAGVKLGWRWTPIDAAGLYAPGGLAAYPSSVLMNAIPARIAGVRHLALVTPAPQGEMNPLVLAAAKIAGVDEIYRIGGAQAIAALAFGAGPIAPVDVIVGPGNAYVAEAKRQVFGHVGIDAIAGPSEILVVADGANDPNWIAADLLSQAEHDPSSQSILITDDAQFGDRVVKAADAQTAQSLRRDIVSASWADNGAVIIVRALGDAAEIVNFVAPEHLELAVEKPDALLGAIRHAGAIFVGRYTPEAVGDYVAGPDHVLPTSRAARYASGLSVLDFMKRTSIIECNQIALGKIGPSAARLADAEGLPAHARSIRIRLPR